MTFEGQRNLYIRGNQPLLARLKIFMIHFFEKDQSFLVIYGQSINQDGMLSMDWWDELAFASSLSHLNQSLSSGVHRCGFSPLAGNENLPGIGV